MADIVQGVVSKTLTFNPARRFGSPYVRTRTSAPGYAGFGPMHTLNERLAFFLC
jgi:hypothetical protein